MWLGKLAIILYIFSGVLLIVGLMIERGLNVALFSGWTYDAVNNIADAFDLSGIVDENPLFIFGNFYAAASGFVTLLFNGVTGGIVQDAFSQLPFWNDLTMLLVRFLYTASTFVLGIHLVTGRINA